MGKSSYKPRFQPQLYHGEKVPGKTQGSVDCGPRAWAHALDAASKGAKTPHESKLRERAKKEGPQQTNVYDAEKAINSFDGMKYVRKQKMDDIKKAVEKGTAVHLCIDYGRFNKEEKSKTGDPNFSGGHSVAETEQKKTDGGTVKWLLFDSLDDARRKGIPQGPRWVKRSSLVEATKSFGSGGKIYAGVVKKK